MDIMDRVSRMEVMDRIESSVLLVNDDIRLLDSFEGSLSCAGNTSASALAKSDSRNRPPKPPANIPSMHKSFSSAMLVVEDGTRAQACLDWHISEQISFSSSSSNVSSASEEPSDFSPVLRSGCWCEKGSRSTMEDAHIAVDDLSGLLSSPKMESPQGFYGVFDGHYGANAACFAKEKLLYNLVADPLFRTDTHQAFVQAFDRTDSELEELWKSGNDSGSGTTALTALIIGRKLFVANTGDCRAVLSRKGRAVELSTDHRPSCCFERKRIKEAGGVVEDDYLNGVLGVARALGDWHLGLKSRNEWGEVVGPLICEPEIKEENLQEDDEFLILACDGLWDVFSNQNAVEFTRQSLQIHNDPELCSKELASEALKRHCTDNLTVIVVCFKESPPPVRQVTAWRSVRRCSFKRSISVDGLKSLQEHLDKS